MTKAHPTLTPSQARQIDQICDRFEEAWRTGGRPRIEEFLAEADPVVRLALLREVIAVELHYRDLGGETPAREEYRQRFPDDTLVIEEVFENEGARWFVCDLPPASAGASAPVGDMRYSQIRLHAKGGLGEVHLAQDAELNREVALKRIQQKYRRDPDSLRRFMREAEITGSLEHPGIVPVYGLVRDKDGQPCYATRFIQGETLREAIREYHQEKNVEPHLLFRELLGRFGAVCQTMAYAHSRGIVHRDLKPGNIMLGQFGETLVVDWGLAKAIQPDDTLVATGGNTLPASASKSAAEGEPETHTGEALGTPAYISPEQAAGQWDNVGPASDIFSLGATFYELLTGRPPFAGPIVAEMLEKSRRGDYLPPRQVNRDVPRALEAVCLKAMALKPENRYASAGDTARDVERWLADEPVSADREPLTARLGRWVRRHRLLVAGGVASLMVAVVLLTIGLVLLNGERQRTADALGEAQKSMEHRRAALDDLTSLMVQDLLKRQKVLTSEHKKFLRRALSAYEEFAEDANRDEISRARVADAHLRVGTIRQRLGEKNPAQEALRQATKHYASLAADFADNPKYQIGLIKSQRNLGVSLEARGLHDQALAAYKDALAASKKLDRRFNGVAEHKHMVAKCYMDLGDLAREKGKRAEAEKAFSDALALYEKLTVEDPNVADYQTNLAGCHNQLARMYWARGRKEDTLKSHRAALAIKERLVARLPKSAEHKRDLALTHYNMGVIHWAMDQFDEALTHHLAAMKLRKYLARSYQNVPDYQNELAQSFNNLGLVHKEKSSFTESQEAYTNAIAVLTRLTEEYRDEVRYRQDLARSWNNLGILFKDTDRLAQAETPYHNALKIQREMAHEFPEVPYHQNDLAGTMVNFANLMRLQKKYEPARKLLQDAKTYHEAALKRYDKHPMFRLFYRHNRKILTAVHISLKDHKAAAKMAEEVIQVSLNHKRDLPVVAGLLAECVELVKGDDALDETQQKALSEQYGRRAVELLRQALQKGYIAMQELEQDEALAPLRSRPDYQKLMQKATTESCPPQPPI